MQRYFEKHEYNHDSKQPDPNSNTVAHSQSNTVAYSKSNTATYDTSAFVPIDTACANHVDTAEQQTIARATCDAASGRLERFSIDDFESDRGSECNVSY